jgi:uncharacterized repeat protein (TIGR01451 family)/gliding motility-associated-like protein
MRNFTFTWSKFFRLNFLIAFLLLGTYNASAQFYTKHYIAPAPWQYFSKSNEIVIATNSLTTVNITLTKSDGTLETTLTATKGNPAIYRFKLLAKDLPMYALDTVINAAGLIVSSDGPTSVNMRNVASDNYVNGENVDANLKGNAALTSFGDAGIGVRFRVGYYRNGSLGNFGSLGDQRPIYSVMATVNNTTIKINNVITATLNTGQSYLFKAPIGTLVESSNPCVMNTSAAIDMPGGCGDGAFNQIPPEAVLGTEYFIERGTGNDIAEQTTVVATKDNTVLTVNGYSTTGVLASTNTVTLALAGDFYTFINGVSNTSFTASRVAADKRVVVYSGTAQSCEVDISTIAPVSECGGSNFIETAKFRNYTSGTLDYFGYILLRSATEVVQVNGTNIETVSGITARHQIGTTGWYLINFKNTQIGSPDVLSISSNAKLTVSIVQQDGGFSMAGFFSNFAAQPEDPTLTYISGGGCTNNKAELTTPAGFAPYQWYLNGTAITGANSATYTATKTGAYSVASTLTCGAQTQSKPVSVTLCTDLGITKTVDNVAPCIGSNVEFTVKLNNLGGNNVSGVSVNDLLPSGYTYVSSIPSIGSYNSGTGVWSIGDLDGETEVTLKITAKVNASGIYTNTASLPTSIDDNAANNSASVAINPKTLPTLVITNPAAVCSPSTADLTASSVTAGSSANLTLSYWTNAAATISYTTPGTATAGTYYIKAVSSEGCEVIKQIVVTVDSPSNTPTISVVSGSVSCSTGSVVLKSSGNSGSYLWSTGETTREITVTVDGNYTVKRINSSGCVSNSSAPTVVTFKPSAPTASAQFFCSSEGKTVNDLIAAGINLKWYNTNTSTPAFAGSTALTTKTYYVSQTAVSGCESARTAVAVTVNTVSSAPVASAQAFCASENKTIHDLIATGTGVQWYDTNTSTTPLTGTTALISKTYYVSQTANSCGESARTAVVVTINTIPTAPTASSQAFCAADAKKVSDLIASGSNLKWYNGSTGGTLYNATDILSSGNYYVSQSNSCGESARALVAVTVNNTIAPTASSQIFCATDGKKVSNLQATGSNLKWYAASTGGSAYAGTETLSTGNYYVSQTLNSCESSRVLVPVTVDNAAPVPTASAQTFCASEGKTVNDLIASGNNLKWYTASIGGTLYTGTETLSSGNYFVSQTTNSCGESARALVAVTINPTPAAPTITPEGPTTFCSGGTVVLTSSGGNDYLWSTGETTESITVSTSGNYNVKVTNASGCQSAASALTTVTVNPIPSAPIALAQTFCLADNRKISDLTPSGTGIKWYSASTGGIPYIGTETLVTGTYFASQSSNGCESTRTSVGVTLTPKPSDIVTTATICSGETYTWAANNTPYTTNQSTLKIVNDGCTADQVLNLSVTPKPSDIVTTATICSGETYIWAANNTPYTTNQSTLKIVNDGCTADQVLNLSVTPKPSDIVTTATICSGETYTWAANNTPYTTNQSALKIVNNGCTADQVLNLSVTPKPTKIVTTVTICLGESYLWSVDGNTYTGANTYTITNNGCTADQELVLNVDTVAKPIVGIITQPTCASSFASVELSGLPSGTWTINPGNITGNTNTTVITGLVPGTTYNYSVTNFLGCKSLPSADVTILDYICAENDTPITINGLIGGTSSTVFANDKVNGTSFLPADVSVSATTLPIGITFNLNGTITVAPNTSTGTHLITYTICKSTNSSDCDSATVEIIISLPIIDAVKEITSPSINGNIGGTTASLVSNDTLNGNVVVIGTNAGEVILSPVSVPTGLTLNADGTLKVAAGTPAGTYNVEYKICEVNNPTNCDSVISEVVVTGGTLKANTDTIGSVVGINQPTTLINVFANDTNNGLPVVASTLNLSVTTPDPTGFITLGSDGTAVLGANASAGIYELIYQICEKLNPTNCSSASIKVTVTAPVIDAVKETTSPINGTVGGTTASLVSNDTLNGSAVVIGTNVGEVILSPVSVPTEFTLNADGTIKVAAGTPAGTYNVEYKICEVNNPTNCDSVISEVVVIGGTLQANPDTIGSVVGINQPTTLINVFANDTNNGLPVVASAMNLSVLTADPTGFLTLNPDGTAVLEANAPAGIYELIYQICEKLNPTNCSSASIKVTVTAPTMVVTANSYCSDNVPYVSYTVTADNFTPNYLLTIKWIDSANNVVATQTNLPLSGNILWPGAIIDNNGIGIDWPGWILTNGQWAEGTDGFEKTKTAVTMEFSLNSTVSIAVNYPPATPQCNARPTFAIKANNDIAGPIDANKGISTSLNIFDNDTLNGVALNRANAILTTVVPNANLVLNANGSVEVKSGTPSGNYQLTYQICDALNSSNCSQAIVSVNVLNVLDPAPPASPKIIATNDIATNVDGINGELEFINILDNDLLNGVTINPVNIVISNTPQSPYFEFNSDGTVNVKPNTPGGNYVLTYQVCEKANSSNCVTATLNVFVEVPAIAIVKTGVFNDENANGFANAGETVTYKFKVSNTGNVPLSGIMVSDPLTGIVLLGQAINLNVNESDENNFTAQYKITQNDINKGSVSNQASVQGHSAKGVVVDDKSDDVNNAGDNPTVVSLDGCQIKVLNGFSPNGDGKNARFYIQGLECYPDNTVEIYNRWGVLVFDIDHYNNEDRAFVGISAGRATVKQTDGLPVGTYFYILKYKDSASKQHELSGYLYMNK